MDKDDTSTGGISESELVGLLASLKVEPAPETDFEGRFLYDLRERLARESVCCPARRLLWDHILQLFSGFGSRKLAYGASTLGLGALAVSLFALPGEPASSDVAVKTSPLSRLENSLAALRSNCGHEAAQTCTTIRICEQKKAPYTDASLASGSFSASFGHILSPSVGDTIPVNMGMNVSVQDAFPTYTTAAGF